MNQAGLDTNIDSDVLNVSNAAQYRQQHGVSWLSVITEVKVITGFPWVQNTLRPAFA